MANRRPMLLFCIVHYNRKKEETQEHFKIFQSIRLFKIGICGMERQQNFHGTFLVSSWICFCQEWLKVEYSRE